MPIFEYSCQRCHHNFERIVLSAGERIQCPACDSGAVEKRLSVFNAPNSRGEESPPNGGGCGGCSPQGCGCH